MNARRPIRSLVALITAIAAACGDSTRDPSNAPDDAPLATQRFAELSSPAVRAPNSTTPLRLVITTQAAWQQFWTERFAAQQPMPPLPVIDFATEVIVAVTGGQKPTGGFAIRVESVTERGGELEALVVDTAPGAACGVTLAVTFPFDVIRVPRANRAVRFVERQATGSCG